MQDSNQLSALATNQLQGLCEFPEDFPDIRFDWVTEDDLQTKLRVEASAPGTWQLSENFWVRNIKLKAEIDRAAPSHQSEGKLEGELKLGHNTISVYYPFPGPYQWVSNLKDIPLEQLILPMASSTDLFRQIPAFRLREADFACLPHTHAFTLHGTTDDPWILPIGREGLPLQQLSMDLSGQGEGHPIDGKLHASIRLNGVETRLTSPASNASLFTGTHETLYVSAVLDAICDRPSLRALPSPFDPELRNVSIQIDLGERTVTLQGTTDAYGPTAVVIQEHDGIWGFTAEAELPQRWRLSTMDAFLQPLDNLDQSQTTLIVTSFSTSPYPLGENEEGEVLHARCGYNLLIRSTLSGLGELNFLSGLVAHPDPITFLGTFARREHRPIFLLTGKLPSFTLADGISLLSNEIQLTHQEHHAPRLVLNGPAQFVIGETELPMTGKTQVRSTEALLEATLDEPWDTPYGVRGFQIPQLALDVHIDDRGQRTMQAAGLATVLKAKGVSRVYWNEDRSAPLIWASFEDLPSTDLLNGLLPSSSQGVRPEVRKALEKGFQNVEMTLHPHGNQIQGEFPLAGAKVQFQGVFGDASGLDAYGSMQSRRWLPVAGGGHFVELSAGSRQDLSGVPEDFTPHFSGPLVRLYLGPAEQEPPLQLAAQCTLFTQYSQNVVANMSQEGLTFPIEIREDEFGALQMECLIKEDRFRGEGEIGIKIETDLHLKEPKSGIVLGVVSVNGAVRAKLKLEADRSFRATFEGHLIWKNHELEFPPITLTKPPADLRELRQQLSQALDERAYFLFKPLLPDEDAFFTAAGDWLLTGRNLDIPVADLAQAVRNAFSANPNSLSVGFYALGYPTKEVALALKSTNRSADSLAKALHAANCNAIEIADALHHGLNANPGAIAGALRQVGHDPIAIATGLKMGCSTHPVSVAHALKSLNQDPFDIGSAIRSVFLIPVAVAYPIFKTAGFKARETIRALVVPYQTGPEETAQLLLGAGYSEREVRTAMEKEMGVTDLV